MSFKFKNNKNLIIRSSQTSILFSNKNKIENINLFINEYKKVTQFFIDNLWEIKNTKSIKTFGDKNITSKCDKSFTWLSQRAMQCAEKQASGIVRGTRKKYEKRLFQLQKFNEEGIYRKARKLLKIIEKYPMSKPEIKNISPELDSRFIKINLEKENSFDGWITLYTIGKKLNIVIPFKKTKHLNKMLGLGKIKSGIRLSNNFITFNFEIPKVEKKIEGKSIGIDIGIKNVWTSSENKNSEDDKHGWNLDKIQNRLCKRLKGSNNYKKTQKHRTNYINYTLNKIDLENIKTLILENIYDMRRGRKTSKYLSRWTFTEIRDKLDSLCEKSGVQIIRKGPTYTSQRCSKCGWTCKKNRNGKKFVCTSCGFSADADLNASINISLDLPEISKEERLKRSNIKGFYWNTSSKEPIVPSVQKVIFC